jgi:hypothetical protein
MDTNHLGSHMRDFCTFLDGRGYLAPGIGINFQGHAYRLYQRQGGRTCVGDGVLLIGDAAGLAQPLSGEGILAAIESGLLASDAILEANGDYGQNRLEMYNERLSGRFGGSGREIPSSPLLSGLMRFLGARLLSSKWFCRNIVLDRWFLHESQRALYAAPNQEEADR